MTTYYDLGTYSRPVATTSAEAQLWFDRGLNWTYGFNHEEGIRCFERALEVDPSCAMAWWGMAYAYGPYINKEWRFYAHAELVDCLPKMRAAVEKARAHATDPIEKGLADALVSRYQSDKPRLAKEMDRWNHAFAAEMLRLHQAFPDDLDVMAIAVEALMMRTPWRLWDQQSGEQAVGAASHQMLEILDRGMRLAQVDPHPGICHMVIHTVEMSSQPEQGIDAANALRDLMPDCGHLQHMPTHIDVLCGEFEAAVIASEKAIAADKRYLQEVGPFGQYTAACCHDYHLMMFASMLMGRFSSAFEAALGIENLVSREVLLAATPAFQITLEAYYSMTTHVLIRFGKWEELIAKPLPDDRDLYPATTCMQLYGRAIAYATKKDFEAAETNRLAFEETLATVSPDRHLFNNTTHTVMAIARQMMLGEIAYHAQKYETAFDHLRQAVDLNDSLNYTEPWAWMHPPRHALGALLLAQGQLDEALAVYQADLGLAPGVNRCSTHPNNVWSLHGLVECFEKLGRLTEANAWRPTLDKALALADVNITASCACRLDSWCCH